MPGEGAEIGDDLIVVRRSAWEEAQAPSPPRPRVEIPQVATSPRPPPRVTRPAPPPAPRAPAAPPTTARPPDWWEEAFDLLGGEEIPPALAPAREADDVLETLADLEREAMAPRLQRPPRSRVPPAPARPSLPRTVEAP